MSFTSGKLLQVPIDAVDLVENGSSRWVFQKGDPRRFKKNLKKSSFVAKCLEMGTRLITVFSLIRSS